MIFGNGALIGFTPTDIKAMSIWEFAAAFAGWRKYHANPEEEGARAPTEEQFFAALENLPD